MWILIGSFLVLMVLGLPVALSMAVASLLYILATGIVPDVIIAQRMIAGVESFPLLAVPFFILAGNLMNIAGVTGRIYSFAVALVGWMKGGFRHPRADHPALTALRHLRHDGERLHRRALLRGPHPGRGDDPDDDGDGGLFR